MAHIELDLRERRAIENMLNAKVPVNKIATEIGRHRSTIYREIQRNGFQDDELPELNGYYALYAQNMYEKRRAIHRKMIVHPELKEAIEDRLKACWSPEQITGGMRLSPHGRTHRIQFPRLDHSLSLLLLKTAFVLRKSRPGAALRLDQLHDTPAVS